LALPIVCKAISYAYCQAGIGYANPLAIICKAISIANCCRTTIGCSKVFIEKCKDVIAHTNCKVDTIMALDNNYI
jgi:hypothetical protein